MADVKVIAVTNRSLCTRPFSEQIERVVKEKPFALILREKDLSENEYEALARKVMELCGQHGVKCILHTYFEAAKRLNCRQIHLPLHILKETAEREPDFFRKNGFLEVGASVHSLEDALLAERLGADYVTAGHIFVTDCKKGFAPRGIGFLKEVCEHVSIPVYAIGGIHPDNQAEAIKAGAAGVCMMSEFMKL